MSGARNRNFGCEGRDEVGDCDPQIDPERLSCIFGGVNPSGRPFNPPFISVGRPGNKRFLRIVIRVLRVRDGVCPQLLDHGSMVVDEHSMSGVVDETSEFTRHGIAGKQDTGFQRFYVKPALAQVFVVAPIACKQGTNSARQPAPPP
jgi:hypothetical protein